MSTRSPSSRSWVLVVMVLALSATTIYLGAVSSQDKVQLEKTEANLASQTARLKKATESLQRVQRTLRTTTDTLTACRVAITHSLRAMNLAAQASILETKGSASQTIAALNLLHTAMTAFKRGLPDMHTCRGTG